MCVYVCVCPTGEQLCVQQAGVRLQDEDRLQALDRERQDGPQFGRHVVKNTVRKTSSG